MLTLLLGSLLSSAAAALADESLDQLLTGAREAVAKGQMEEALGILNKAVAGSPKDPLPLSYRAGLWASLGRHAEAVDDFSKVIALKPTDAETYNRRGAEHFKLGHIDASIKDFDKFLELKPKEVPGHWMRGISYYYAGRYDEGRKQFQGYEKVDTNDVENAVWHYLCNARLIGADKARAAMLKIGHDKRIPLMEVYALFQGKAKPEDVLAAATTGNSKLLLLNQQLFYAHLYLGLYYESIGDAMRTAEHLMKAVNDYPLGGYMGDVARVHLTQLKNKRGSGEGRSK